MTDKTVTIPSFLSEAQFNDPAQCQIDDLGPVVCLYVAHLELGAIWMGNERKWVMRYPLTMEEHIEGCRKWLVHSDQMGLARRHAEARGIMPASAIN